MLIFIAKKLQKYYDIFQTKCSNNLLYLLSTVIYQTIKQNIELHYDGTYYTVVKLLLTTAVMMV